MLAALVRLSRCETWSTFCPVYWEKVAPSGTTGVIIKSRPTWPIEGGIYVEGAIRPAGQITALLPD